MSSSSPVVIAAILALLASRNPLDDPDLKFRELRAEAMADPFSVDYGALRESFAASRFYAPVQDSSEDPFKAVEQDRKNGERAAALVALDAGLANRWADPGSQLRAALICEQLGDLRRRDLHRAIGHGLADALLDSGDGQSPETALKVLSVVEENFALEVLGLAPKSHAKAVRDGHHYDVYKIEQPDGETTDFYFNVELPDHFSGRTKGPELKPKPSAKPGNPGRL